MNDKLQNGQTLLQQALFALCCHKGAFARMPDFGSRLYLLPGQKPANRRAFAVNAAQETLLPLGLRVRDAQVSCDTKGVFYVNLMLENSNVILEVRV